MLPPNPALLQHAVKLMSARPILLNGAQQCVLYDAIVAAATQYDYRLLALTIESWHLHWLIDHRFDDVPTMVGRLKTAMRKALAMGRIWTVGYDARYCFTDDETRTRAAYILRHAGARLLSHPHGMIIL